jgi:hypothetical protein
MVGFVEYSAHLIASHGQVATATITAKVMHPAGQEGYTKTSYEEDFAFTTAAGKRIEGKTSLTADSWDRIKSGDTFKVISTASGMYHVGADKSTTAIDCIFAGALVIWVVFLWLTIRAHHRRPSARTAPAGAPDTAADAPRRGVAKTSINGPVFGGAVLLVVGGGFLLTGVGGLVSERGFRVHGKAATAIVLTKSGGHVGVRFTTDEGKLIETSATNVDSATMTSLHEHLPVKIMYAPEHPEKIRLASDDQFTIFVFWGFFTGLGGILAIGGAVMMSFGFLDAKRERTLHAQR